LQILQINGVSVLIIFPIHLRQLIQLIAYQLFFAKKKYMEQRKVVDFQNLLKKVKWRAVSYLKPDLT